MYRNTVMDIRSEYCRLICFEATGLDLYGSIASEVFLAFLPSKFAAYIHYCISIHIASDVGQIKQPGARRLPVRYLVKVADWG